MTIQDFEKKLKEIDPKFEIITHPRNPELAGVYYDRKERLSPNDPDYFVVTVPSQEIYPEFNANHADSTGHPHNWGTKVIDWCNEHLRRLKEDPAYYENFYSSLDLNAAPRITK